MMMLTFEKVDWFDFRCFDITFGRIGTFICRRGSDATSFTIGPKRRMWSWTEKIHRILRMTSDTFVYPLVVMTWSYRMGDYCRSLMNDICFVPIYYDKVFESVSMHLQYVHESPSLKRASSWPAKYWWIRRHFLWSLGKFEGRGCGREKEKWINGFRLQEFAHERKFVLFIGRSA